MALSSRLMLRQGQSLVMTPQLLQAIKLLQLSSQELVAFVQEELERNPLLERAEESVGPTTLAEALADVSGAPISFPDAFWQPGDIVMLQITLGALVGLNTSLVAVTYEKSYTP